MPSARLPASPPLSLRPSPVRYLPSARLPFAASPSPRLPMATSAPSARLPFPFPFPSGAGVVVMGWSWGVRRGELRGWRTAAGNKKAGAKREDEKKKNPQNPKP
ncbi:hypothetical protein GUJ93_ZPchr0013g36870 [Zizania palustris]|uniref:Uncharacterized protein n=1 Tax=Zizania palustris TaxID=103762 RepID=A0A8J5WY46_ZIZPA|nr:hypothetical protein GUJ93_ZPchr0002g23754 [Zizania palustris]KAG8097629.1 hypothetical protein GUJ93_ZPchr0013g36870 [Zizania palustris]